MKAQPIDIVATVFKSHKVRGPIADAMLNAACGKLDKLGKVVVKVMIRFIAKTKSLSDGEVAFEVTVEPFRFERLLQGRTVNATIKKVKS